MLVVQVQRITKHVQTHVQTPKTCPHTHPPPVMISTLPVCDGMSSRTNPAPQLQLPAPAVSFFCALHFAHFGPQSLCIAMVFVLVGYAATPPTLPGRQERKREVCNNVMVRRIVGDAHSNFSIFDNIFFDQIWREQGETCGWGECA